MDSLPFNIIDAVAIGAIMLSAMFAYFRGFVREILSIAAWALAAFTTLALLDFSRDLISQYVPIPLVANGLAIGGVFIILLIVFSALAIPLWSLIGHTGLRPIDRALGVIFGFLRGGLLVMALWIGFAWLVPEASRPKIIETSRVLPYIDDGAKSLVVWVRSMPYGFIQTEGTQGILQELQNALNIEKPSSDTTFQSLNNPQPLVPTSATETAGYNSTQRQDFSRLLNPTSQ